MDTNKRGNEVKRGFRPGDRYYYDAKLSAGKGWIQYDTSQDAPYFGVWVHPGRREIFTYCEGDTTLVSCPTAESFQAELADMAEFYGAPPPMAVSIRDDGTRVEYYDERGFFGRQVKV